MRICLKCFLSRDHIKMRSWSWCSVCVCVCVCTRVVGAAAGAQTTLGLCNSTTVWPQQVQPLFHNLSNEKSMGHIPKRVS